MKYRSFLFPLLAVGALGVIRPGLAQPGKSWQSRLLHAWLHRNQARLTHRFSGGARRSQRVTFFSEQPFHPARRHHPTLRFITGRLKGLDRPTP
jgi:hypothetical protein